MLNARIATIEQVGSDHVCFRETGILTKVTFADDGQFTKEDSAGFFGRFAGKAAAIASSEKREGYFIAVDFWRGLDNNLRAMPLPFAVSSVEVRTVIHEDR